MGASGDVMGAATRREARGALAQRIDAELGPFDPAHLAALVEIDRARFVRPGDEGWCLEDIPLPLDDEGLATISAPHAYLLSFRLLGLTEGDALVELGSGTGYGAALAAFIVGSRGRVTTIEIAPSLARAARALLADRPNVAVHEADAVQSTPLWCGARRVVCTFAIDALPQAWVAALPDGGILVAPVGPAHRDQRLVRVTRDGGEVGVTDHGAVRYVRNRGARCA